MHAHSRRFASVSILAFAAALAASPAFAADPGQTPVGRTSPAKSATTAAASLEQRVAALESKLAALLQAVQVQPSGDVTVSGQNVKLEASKGLNLKAAQNATLEAFGSLTTKAGSNATHQAGGTLDLKGSTAKVPDQTTRGGKTLATVGSPVMGACPPNGGPLLSGQILP